MTPTIFAALAVARLASAHALEGPDGQLVSVHKVRGRTGSHLGGFAEVDLLQRFRLGRSHARPNGDRRPPGSLRHGASVRCHGGPAGKEVERAHGHSAGGMHRPLEGWARRRRPNSRRDPHHGPIDRYPTPDAGGTRWRHYRGLRGLPRGFKSRSDRSRDYDLSRERQEYLSVHDVSCPRLGRGGRGPDRRRRSLAGVVRVGALALQWRQLPRTRKGLAVNAGTRMLGSKRFSTVGTAMPDGFGLPRQ